jgi:hypothetical protein
MLSIIYVIKYRPYDSNFYNWMEIWNETILLMLDYHLFFIINESEKPLLVYHIGWSFVAFFLTMVLINMSSLTLTGTIKMIHDKRLFKLAENKKI